MSRFVTSKDLAAELELNERTIRQPRKQHALGIDECIDRTCEKPIRFRMEQARQALKKIGHEVTSF